MAFSSSADIQRIAENYQNNAKTDEALAGFVGDLEIAEYNNSYNAAQSAKQQAYETEMSNTAHQREVKDLQAAGLNPVLSASLGGSSTPTYTVATADTGVTGSATKRSQAKLDRLNQAAIASANNQATIMASQISASAVRAAAAEAAAASRYATDNSQSLEKYLVNTIDDILSGSSGSSSSTGLSGFVSNAAKAVGNILGIGSGSSSGSHKRGANALSFYGTSKYAITPTSSLTNYSYKKALKGTGLDSISPSQLKFSNFGNYNSYVKFVNKLKDAGLIKFGIFDSYLGKSEFYAAKNAGYYVFGD